MRWCFLLSGHRTNSGGWEDGDEWCCLWPPLFLPHILMFLHFFRPRGRGGIRGGFTGPRGGRRGYQGPRHFRAPRGKNMSLISFLIIAELSTVKGN